MPSAAVQISGRSQPQRPERSLAPVTGVLASGTVTEKMLRALGVVVLTCVAVVVLAPLVLRVLPVLLLLGLVAWMVAQLVGWSRFKGF